MVGTSCVMNDTLSRVWRETLRVYPRSPWRSLASSLVFCPEGGVTGIVIVGKGCGTPQGWPSSEQLMTHRIFVQILCSYIVSGSGSCRQTCERWRGYCQGRRQIEITESQHWLAVGLFCWYSKLSPTLFAVVWQACSMRLIEVGHMG